MIEDFLKSNLKIFYANIVLLSVLVISVFLAGLWGDAFRIPMYLQALLLFVCSIISTILLISLPITSQTTKVDTIFANAK